MIGLENRMAEELGTRVHGAVGGDSGQTDGCHGCGNEQRIHCPLFCHDAGQNSGVKTTLNLSAGFPSETELPEFKTMKQVATAKERSVSIWPSTMLVVTPESVGHEAAGEHGGSEEVAPFGDTDEADNQDSEDDHEADEMAGPDAGTEFPVGDGFPGWSV